MNLNWLPVLTNIAPSDVRRQRKLIETIKKAEDKKSLLLAERLGDVITHGLKSKKTAKNLISLRFETNKYWARRMD